MASSAEASYYSTNTRQQQHLHLVQLFNVEPKKKILFEVSDQKNQPICWDKSTFFIYLFILVSFLPGTFWINLNVPCRDISVPQNITLGPLDSFSYQLYLVWSSPPFTFSTSSSTGPTMPSFCTAYTVYTNLAACLSSHIPLLVKSYFLAAADLFGHSGACMIDVFLAVKHLLYPSLHPLP